MENKNNDPCDIDKRWYGVGFTDPCEKWLDDMLLAVTTPLMRIIPDGEIDFEVELHRQLVRLFNQVAPPLIHLALLVLSIVLTNFWLLLVLHYLLYTFYAL